jgi:tricorn protease
MNRTIRCRMLALIVLLLGVARFSAAADDAPLLAHSPTLSRTQIVFVYGGYLWSVPREGGEARQLTTGGHEALPVFSPDGNWLAFTGQYDGNIDAFVMPAEGGEPRRLTWHPDPDVAVGWTPDSKRVLFRSPREAYADLDRLYTVPVEGGWPEVVLARWLANRVRAEHKMANVLEAL